MQTYQEKKQAILFFTTFIGKMGQFFKQMNNFYLTQTMPKKNIHCGKQVSEIIKKENEFKTKKRQKSKSEKKDIKLKSQKINEKVKVKERIVFTLTPPQTPASSYILFFKDHRQKISLQYPQYSVSAISKIAAQCWRQLSALEKKPYLDKFNIEKEKYYQKLKIYKQELQKFQKTQEEESKTNGSNILIQKSCISKKKKIKRNKKTKELPLQESQKKQETIKEKNSSSDDQDLKI